MSIELIDQDYELIDGGAWIETKGFTIRILDTDEGVVVDIYKAGREMDSPIASTYAFTHELETEE